MRPLISKLILIVISLTGHNQAAVSSGPKGYVAGGIIAILILGYLIYTLMRPEKF